MKKFEFSSKSNDFFSGDIFYNVYKDSEFLKNHANVEIILSKGYELRKMLKDVEPCQCVTIEGMMVQKNTPLIVLKTGPNITVKNYEFTLNRLTGLTAAYAFENRVKFPKLNSSEANALGLKWDNRNEKLCRLFLSAVSGTEHFYNQFQYWPLVCGLRKLQQRKITLEPVIKIAKIKNPSGLRLSNDLTKNLTNVVELWPCFPGASVVDLKDMPLELKKVFFNVN